MNRKRVLIIVACGFIAGAATPAVATFDLMQIEQVIGGVDGDTSAQAIQLRMRSAGQCFVSQGKLMVYDAAGENPVLLIDFQSNVPGCRLGDRVLITSENLACHLGSNPISADFTFTNLIPEDYLDAGSLTFENNAGTVVYWRLSWGGKSYTGPTDGSTVNDDDGDFGPPYDGPLPSDGVQALQFQSSAKAQSTTNQDDYDLTADNSEWMNNAGDSDTVFIDSCPADFCGCGTVGATDLLALLVAWGPCPGCEEDLDCNGTVGATDLLTVLASWGPCPPGTPEPPCPGDLDGNGVIGSNDLMILLTSWGPCEDCDDCLADLDGDCNVGSNDLNVLLAAWNASDG